MNTENQSENGLEVYNNLILKYLNQCFNIKVSDDIIVRAPMNDEMDLDTLIYEINLMFGHKNSRKVCMEWYTRAIREVIGDIFTFLEDCHVRLGPREWLVYNKEGGLIREEKMIEYFCPMYTEAFVTKYFKDWKMDQMIKETEKTMGFDY